MPTIPLPFPATEERPFGEQLRHFREARGLSRADLAGVLGVASVTIGRWETGRTQPSPLAEEKLRGLGFRMIAAGNARLSSAPRLRRRGPTSTQDARAAALREEGWMTLPCGSSSFRVLAAPFVRNGPPDQNAFHNKMLRLQLESALPAPELKSRLSMAEAVEGVGTTMQHRLEKPRAHAVSWNSNYGTHGWHRYVGRFPPHVVRALLNHFGADGSSLVCDPFVGSGTTAVECRLLGIPFVGIEICPLSVMMTRTKAAFPTDSETLIDLAHEFTSYYDDRWTRFLRGRSIGSVGHEEILERRGNPVPKFVNHERWFTTQALLGTSIAVEFAMKQDGFRRQAVLVALSSKMRSIGNVDVDVVRAEYRRQPRENVDVRRLVARQLTKMARDISASAATHAGHIGPASSISIREGSVLDIDIPAGSVTHVITSPPYGVEAISYLRTHLLSYRALVAHLGHDPYDTRAKTIGSEYLTDIRSEAGQRASARSATCTEFFKNTPDEGGTKYTSRRAAMMQFCDDMLSVGERMTQWLKPGGQVAFIIGNKKLGEQVIPMDTIVTELFSTCGLTPRGAIRHKLKTNNSNSKVPWQDRVIQEESILLFRREET